MHKIIGMGETVTDILFRNNQPIAAVPGGSSFNSIISVGRSGVPCSFIGYTGDDRPGREVVKFLRENGVDTTFFEVREGTKSSISLAYLNESGDADYTFYKDMPQVSKEWSCPEFNKGDALLYGSYYAICRGMRCQVTEVLKQANSFGATVYYDINFRRSHKHELEDLRLAIKENFRLSTIVRGSADDFDVMYGNRNPQEIYDKYIRDFCSIFICTSGSGKIYVCTPSDTFSFNTPQIPADKIVSTVGAGDNFNAGLLCEIIKEGLTRDDLPSLSREGWGRLIDSGIHYASMVCQSTSNSIPVHNS